MTNDKNKGFTLIELLAVIVILAVIALIAVPKIIEILNKAKLSAAEDSTMGIVEATESYVASFMLQNQGAIPKNLEFACDSTGCNLKTNIEGYNKENLTSLEFKGKKPTSGAITVSDSGKNIIVNNLKISGFTCIYDGESSTCGDYKDRVVLSEEFEDKGITGGYEGVKAIVYLDPTDLTKECNENNIDSTTEKYEGCMKWYAYKDEDGKYTMILDHNATATVAWYAYAKDNTQGPKEVLEALRDATTTWSDKLVTPTPYTANWTYNNESYSYTIDYSIYGNKARLISAEEVAEITKNDMSDGQPQPPMTNCPTSDLNFRLGSNCWYLLDRTTGECYYNNANCIAGQSKYAWLFDNTQNCTIYGCNVAQSENAGYWTSSPNTLYPQSAWIMKYYGILDFGDVQAANGYGVRPVITVKKSDLLQ